MSESCKVPYVSVIKINGEPILPPIITTKLRKELLKYKQQAVKLEQRLENCKKLKQHLNSLLEQENPTSETYPDALNICDKSTKRKPLKNLQLSKDLIEVTQYNGNGFKTLCSNVELINENNRLDFDNTEKTHNRSKSATRDEHLNETFIQETPIKPRLIRSNSYTLETPSPILLEHLKAKDFSSSLNLKPLQNNYMSFKNNSNSPHSDSASSPEYSSKNTAKNTTPAIEVLYQTDISVQQITVNSNKTSPNVEKKQKFFTKDTLLKADYELMNVLKDIPEIYANQVLELLKKQHTEQKERLEKYDQLGVTFNGALCKVIDERSKNGSGSSIDLIDLSLNDCNEISAQSRRNTAETVDSADTFLKRSSTFSISPSQSICYSINSNTTIPAQKNDLLNLDERNLEIGVLREKTDGYYEGMFTFERDEDFLNEFDPIKIQFLRKERAVTIINAHVRGYLTRRLLKTQKVQNLIGTVKDCLVCAVELHNSTEIDEKDVELHRRLINQLSAALYSFHDIFFELSTAEQMCIIGADRQRKREKLKKAEESDLSRSSSGYGLNSRSASKFHV